jgi:YesN/AraC family two-component response regulator
MLIITSAFYYYTTKSIVLKEAAEPQLHLLRIGLESVEAAVQDVDEVAINVMLTQSVLDFINPKKTVSLNEIKSLVGYLGNLSVSPNVDNILVYDTQRQRMVSSNYGFSSSLEDLFIESWKDTIPKELNGMSIHQIKLSTSSSLMNSPKNEIVLMRPILLNNKHAGVIMIVMNSASLFANSYDNQDGSSNIFRFVSNARYELVHTISGTTQSIDPIYDLIQSRNMLTFEYKQQDKNYLYAQLWSEYIGWTFGALIPQVELLHPLNRIRTIMIVLTMASIIAGVSGLIYFYYMSFRPFRRITNLLQRYEGSGHFDANKFTMLIEQLSSDTERLSHALEQRKNELNVKYIIDLLQGNVSQIETQERWQRLFHTWDKSPMVMLILSIDCYDEWSSGYSNEDIFLFKYALKNIAEEMMSVSYKVMIIDYKFDIVLIFQQRTGDQLNHDTLKAFVQEYIQVVHSMMNISISAAIGHTFTSADEFKTDYYKTEYALRFRLYRGYQHVIQSSSIEGIFFKSLNARITSALLESLDNGNMEMAEHYLNEIHSLLQQDQIDPEESLDFFDEVMMSLHQYLENNGLEKPKEVQAYYRGHFHFYAMNDIVMQMRKVIAVVGEMSKYKLMSRGNVIVTQMVNFMKQNISKNIGIQEIAEHFDMGRSTIHVLFKKEMNTSIYDYLTQLRMEQAKELLISTQLKVSEIATRTGYLNDNSFIRSFRKIYNLTPGQYRSMQRTQQIEE